MTKPIRITSSGEIMNHSTIITDIIITAGADAASLTLRQETVSGEIKFKYKVPANESAHIGLSKPTEIKDGVYAVLTGTNAEAYVYFD